MRVWESIEVNDIVWHNNKKYKVIEKFKDENTMYATLKSIEDGSECRAALYGCTKCEN